MHTIQACRSRGAGGAVGAMEFQFLADQLTLSQPGGADYAHHNTIVPPPYFHTLLRPFNAMHAMS